jgi:hypothetical protein
MPYFYFHLQYSHRLASADEAIELPNLAAAKREATLGARDILIEAIKFGKKRVPVAFVIADDTGKTVHTLSLAAVLPDPFKK